MATVDRQIPSLDTFLCEPWSSFVSAAKLRLVDSKLARRRCGCFRGETAGKCVVQLSVIELREPSPPRSVCFCQSAAKVSVRNISIKFYRKWKTGGARRRPRRPTAAAPRRRWRRGTRTEPRAPPGPRNACQGGCSIPTSTAGVQDPETKRPCTRSLTCKTHSLTHRRAVPGRRKHFDRVASHETASPSKPHCPNGRLLSSLKLRLANAHIPRSDTAIHRVPGPTNSTFSSVPPAPVPGPASHPEPSAHSWTTAGGDGTGRLSSDEGDAETTEDGDRPSFHCSNHHPQPLGCCVFSSRLMGRGYYVFDRRWHRMRLALQNMVEKHLNAQMWR
uniref:Ataxin 7-like 1 n=1 Tax=Tetraodon nigroviridis TaxID=99883 RepID=H3DMB7_TETNG